MPVRSSTTVRDIGAVAARGHADQINYEQQASDTQAASSSDRGISSLRSATCEPPRREPWADITDEDEDSLTKQLPPNIGKLTGKVNRTFPNEGEQTNTDVRNAHNVKDKYKDRPNDVIRIIQVPDEYVGIVIGKNGARLHEISEKSEAKINARCDEEGATGTKAFKVTGNIETVEKASQIIKQIIQGAREYVARIIQVPDEYVGRVIGRNRVRLREISEESEAKINTRCDEEDAPGTKAFKLTGNTEAVGKAFQIINQIIQGAREKGREKENQWQGNGWQYRTNNYW